MKTIRFEPVFRAINLPCAVLKPENDRFLIVDANAAYLQITGSTAEDLVGRCSCEAFPKNPALDSSGGGDLRESLRRVVIRKEKELMEVLRLDIPVRATGEFLEKYWKIENVPVLDDSGELLYVLHMVQDITAQELAKKKEQKLQQEAERNRQQFSHFVEANPNGLYSLSMEGKFLNVNQGLAEIAEVPQEELLKMDFLPFCAEEDKDFILEEFHKALSGESTKFEARFVSAKGRELILEISLVPMKSDGQVLGAYGIARDLTFLKQSEKIIVTKRNYLHANAAFIKSLLQNELSENTLHDPLAMVGEAVDVDRIFYFMAHSTPDTGESVLSLKMTWSNGKVASEKDNPQLQNIPEEEMKEVIGRLERNRLNITVKSELPEGVLKEWLGIYDIKAIMVLPIFLKNRLQGIIALHDCTRERQWNEEEILFLQALTDNLTTTLEKRAAKGALKEQQEALRLSEQKFKALVQESADLFAIMDLQGNFIFKSDSTARVLGTAPVDYVGRNAHEFIHPDDREAVSKQFANLEMVKQFKLSPYRFRTNLGEWRWLETTLTNLTEDPAVQGVVANSRDITRLLAQEREIKQINERYRLAATATQDLMYDWDFETDKVTRFHKGLPDFLGHAITTVDQRHFWSNHIHPDELEDLRKNQDAVLSDREQDHISAEYRFRRADGSYAHLIDRAYIIRNSDGNPIRMVGATSDISELKAKEEDLKIANSRFKLATKATKELIWDWDIITGEVFRGKAFEKISGYEMNTDFEKLNFWFSRIHPQDRERVKLSLSTAVKDSAIRKWQDEYRLIKADGEIAYIMDRGFIGRDAAGAAIRMVGSSLDATESRTAMKRIKQQNQQLREIAWDQSHLVRAPLARMKSLLDLLVIGETSELNHDDILQHLVASYEELDQIVRNIVKKSEMLEEVE